MKTRTLVLLLLVLSMSSCRRPAAVAEDDGAAREAAVAELELERERLRIEREAVEAEKEALRLQREAELQEREAGISERERALIEQEGVFTEWEENLEGLEGEMDARFQELSERELEVAGTGELEDWTPDEPAAMQAPVADFNLFYENLEPYGSWFETPDYGYVYQPTIVIRDTSWRPYTRGRWICTNLGWTWYSDEPFGWACFHYGRWALLAGRGWCWVPGSEWAPSWVAWRQGGGHVGWAPLPPETLCYKRRGWGATVDVDFGIGHGWFNFVEKRHIADPPWRHCLPLARNREILRLTQGCTNLRYHNQRMIAGGPRYQELLREVGRPWPVHRLDLDTVGGLERGRNGERMRLGRISGDRLHVFAPSLDSPWNAGLRPGRVAGKWEQVEVVRSESGLPRTWAERFRASREERESMAQQWTKENEAGAQAKAEELRKHREAAAAAQAVVGAERARRMVEATAARELKVRQAAEAREAVAGRQRAALERSRPGRRELPEAAGEESVESQVPDSRETAGQAEARQAARRGAPDRGIPGGRAGRDPVEARVLPQETAELQERNREQARQVAADQAAVRQQEIENQRLREEQLEAEAARRAAGQVARQEAMEQARQQQELARQQQLQQQEQARMAAEERARQQQEMARRGAEERARQQEEQFRRNVEQQERQRAAQEQARRAAEERARQQQEQQQERQRAAQEQAQRAAEERARQQQDQAERARQFQEQLRESQQRQQEQRRGR